MYILVHTYILYIHIYSLLTLAEPHRAELLNRKHSKSNVAAAAAAATTAAGAGAAGAGAAGAAGGDEGRGRVGSAGSEEGMVGVRNRRGSMSLNVHELGACVCGGYVCI